MTDITLPTLTQWAEQHITALLKASDKNVDSVYDMTFARDCKITVNGQAMTGAQFKDRIRREKGAETGAQVAFMGAVEVPDGRNDPYGAGNVGLFMHATIDQPFMTLGEPDFNTIRASYNMRIVEDPTLPQPEGRSRNIDWDPRRIVAITDVSMERSSLTLQRGYHRSEL
ncbi:hypothetical protein EIP86_005860 [Pleurotus ostreatoroseus]|nr:hypothetical protein EIP86_005860 [Pleurotus ostreatoroseus]